MTIQLENISKRYGFEWIFKKINYQFEPDGKYAVIGPNGSGKSTLLKIISGGLVPTSGVVKYSIPHQRTTDVEQASKQISFAAPYISLIEDFTLDELFDFHSTFKTMLVDSNDEFLEIAQLTHHRKKYIKHFSSGMRQRTKLALSFLTKSSVLILDEPTSNFDTKAVDWYQQLINEYTKDRLLIIGSNQEYEYSCCNHYLSVVDYK